MSSSSPSLARAPHHDGSVTYLGPVPTRPGGSVRLRVHVPAPGASRVRVRWGQDGEPRLRDLTPTPAFDGQWWTGELPLVNARTSYRFLIEGPDGARHRWLTAEGVSEREVSDRSDFVLDASDAAPDWVADQVAYQIFPDRFARSAAAADRELPDWAVPQAWDEPVVAAGGPVARQLYGGDLDGIAEHLDHLVDLGVTTLYLTPVFEGRSNHRYDAVSFDRVDPVLGGDDAYRRLIDAAHARGLRVLGDLTTNHTGSGHEWFRAAAADPTGVEAGFYLFDDQGYHCWLGHPSLPTLDYRGRELRERMYGRADSVVARWVDAGLDGWRIDVANMTGRQGGVDLTREVARGVREAMTRVNADTWLLAEHFFDASADLVGDGWHGVMDYAGASMPLWWWLAAPGARPHATVPLPIDPLPARDVVATMREVHARYPWAAVTASTVHLDSHDTARFRTLAGGGEHGGVDDGSSDSGLARARHLLGAGLQLTLPGVPALFAGDELGLTATTGEHARTPIPWDARETWDAATLDAYRELVALRREHPALRRGGLRWLSAGVDHLTFVREHPAGRVLVHAVRPRPDGAAPRDGEVRLPAAVLGGDAADAVTLRGEGLVRLDDGDEPVLALPGSVGAHLWLLPGDDLAWT
ncbi:alpha-glucosidase [Salana multivorans]|uniref:Alpha-glucosidase n=1 Tax=Salana multivorans TaxID=120377 RepID=A0A3N2D0E3_9MICO|nr:glycoside hydrolase family 13 protein [Salana multivorans]ROR93265.1 alpha-glucosidase [Salana multivorans]